MPAPLPTPKESVDEQGNKVIHDQFTDIELRYRQRYVDLIVNPRSRILSSKEAGYFIYEKVS